MTERGCGEKAEEEDEDEGREVGEEKGRGNVKNGEWEGRDG